MRVRRSNSVSSCVPASADQRLVLHSSWRGILGAAASSALLAALTVFAWGAGVTVISVALTVATSALAAITALDYPIAAEFGPNGVVRRCPLRRHVLAWSNIDALTRTADSAALEHDDGSRGRAVRRRPGGLAARVGRRRYLLVNQCESRAEAETLRRLLADWDVPTAWSAGLPTEDQPPTWLYRRRRWRP